MTVPPDLRAWIESEAESPVHAAFEMEGATTATVHLVELGDGRSLVAKRFDRQDFLDERPDRAEHEATVLEMLAPTAVPVPDLLAVDGDGSRAGAPTVLMSFVEGTTMFPEGWVGAIAANLADIHRVDPGAVTWPYERYTSGQDLVVPSWATDRVVWEDAYAIAEAAPPETKTGFIHRDYHGGNLLWRQGRPAAVLDWLSGCVGPVAIDLAHLRNNLAMDHDTTAADAVLDTYRALAPDHVWHPAWDVIDAVDFLPFYDSEQAVEEWRWDDRPAAETRARFDRLLSETVGRVG